VLYSIPKMGVSQNKKIMISLMSALLFFIIANPETFKLVRRVLGGWVSSPTGCPTVSGLWVHSLVYFVITLLLMNTGDKEYLMGEDESTQSVPMEKINPVDTEKERPPEDSRPVPKITNLKVGDVQPYDEYDESMNSINLTTMLGGKEKGTYDKCECESGKSVVVMN